MIVNHASTLSVEYFIQYLELVMKSRQIPLKEAEQYMSEQFFKGNPQLYGESTASHFKEAINRTEMKS
ncbi:hypothetical protein M3603_14885 [Rummeliibacillus stabekisii]|uniref:hypothetical protein n=1 Tax=Rummeliibacillus stabekisii TaxID=241244 RepID=UPI0020413937|nr:hypothetical protein [Rummeliibacillus stabekisii]MCM3317909.1 hypothetical protein [Rummeliibacillus stabekisii]